MNCVGQTSSPLPTGVLHDYNARPVQAPFIAQGRHADTDCRYRDRVNALFEQWDVLITSATPIASPVIGTDWLRINGTRHHSRAAMGLLTQPVSFASCPVVAASMWPEDTGGMPIGVQIIAATWREDLCLRAAQVLQNAGVAQLCTRPAGLDPASILDTPGSSAMDHRPNQG